MIIDQRRLNNVLAKLIVLGAVLAATLAVGLGLAANASAAAMQRLSGCTASTLPGNDDGSTGSVPLGFQLYFQGTNYDHVFVNNNGNVTFGGSLSAYTPSPIGTSPSPIIAPFWADVDTSSGNAVTYGTTSYQGHPAFCVEWDGVGYFSAHTDKLNKFELILASRPDRAAGDFDIIFNYDQIQWETGSASGGVNGLGGSSARVGFGLAGGGSSELSGSGTNGAFLDGGPAALVSRAANSGTPGMYVYQVLGGQGQGEAGLHGLVSSHNEALVGAWVQACTDGSGAPYCATTQTDGQGKYSFTKLADGLWNVTANPPSGDRISQTTKVGPVQIKNSAPVNRDIVMSTLTPPPTGTVVGGSGTFGNGQPKLDWNESTPFTTNGCAGGTSAKFEIVVPANSPSGDPRTITSGPLSEGPSGTYTGTIPPLNPFYGFAQIKVTIECPSPSAPVIGSFDIYVDPSGHVVDTKGVPVRGATVTLTRSDSADGPFAMVPDGSSIMAPNNRSNPSTTDSAGRFGWDVIAGYYKVSATKPGCANPTHPTDRSASTGVLTVPPPVTNLRLVLNCNPLSHLHARALRNGKIRVSFVATGRGRVSGKASLKSKKSKKHNKGKSHRSAVASKAHRRHKGKRHHKGKKKGKSRLYGKGGAAVARPARVTFTISPSRTGRALLKQSKRLKVAVLVAFKSSVGGASKAKRANVVVRYGPKKHKKQKHKHHKRHAGG